MAAGDGALPEWVLAELSRLLPELSSAALPEGEALDARHRLFEAVAAAIAHSARQAPLLLVVEDLHWADRATLQMLGHVIRTVGWAPLLVAGSLRDEGADAAPALQTLLGDLRRERRLETVALAGLSEQEAGELAAAWLGSNPRPISRLRCGDGPRQSLVPGGARSPLRGVSPWALFRRAAGGSRHRSAARCALGHRPAARPARGSRSPPWRSRRWPARSSCWRTSQPPAK